MAAGSTLHPSQLLRLPSNHSTFPVGVRALDLTHLGDKVQMPVSLRFRAQLLAVSVLLGCRCDVWSSSSQGEATWCCKIGGSQGASGSDLGSLLLKLLAVSLSFSIS